MGGLAAVESVAVRRGVAGSSGRRCSVVCWAALSFMRFEVLNYFQFLLIIVLHNTLLFKALVPLIILRAMQAFRLPGQECRACVTSQQARLGIAGYRRCEVELTTIWGSEDEHR